MSNSLLTACGIYNLLLAAFHLSFWRLFGWRRDLARLQPYNRGIVQILNLRLTHVFVLFGLACLFYGQQLATTPLGHFLLGGMALFWVGRTVEQFVFSAPPALGHTCAYSLIRPRSLAARTTAVAIARNQKAPPCSA